MSLDQLKRMAVFFLEEYKAAWKENAALRSMIASVPMSDGTKGIPEWEQNSRHTSQMNGRKLLHPIRLETGRNPFRF